MSQRRANYFIERVMEKIRATYGLPVPQGGLALTAAAS
jgi:hypothetical protein